MTFETTLTESQKILTDGLLAGVKFGTIVSAIVDNGFDYGTENAKTEKSFMVTIEAHDYETVVADAVSYAFGSLFANVGLKQIVREVTLMGAAYGFQNAKIAA